LCTNPELAAEVAFGPIQDFDFDVAILFSDLLFPLDALGMGLSYTELGPLLTWHLTPETISKLKPIEEAVPQLEFQKKAVQLTIQKIPKNKSVIGFVGGVWTLYTYAVHGKHEGSLIEAKKNLDLQEKFYEIMLKLLKENIQLQLDGGAEIVMIFDTAAGELSYKEFERLVVQPLQTLSETFPKKLVYYSKGTSESSIQKVMKMENLAGVGVDHRIDLPKLITYNKIGITQGNFDQSLLFRERQIFESTLREYLKPFLDMTPNERKGWVCGLGHGVLPKTPEENVKAFVEIIRRSFA
ncbi:MAG: uroporphyrinogen decarboxylase, partial [Leptospiraceae bacterium]|nr:uroporphyrinogen decarboxylase [Leptospiraceae bacterium]